MDDEQSSLASRSFAMIFFCAASNTVVPNGTAVPWSLQLCNFGACGPVGRWPSTCSRCDVLHSEPTLPARLHHHPHTDGHFHRPHASVRLAHADRVTGRTEALVAPRGNSWRVVRRGKPRVKHSATCSMHLRTDRSRHVHTSVHSARRARRSSGCHGQGATPPCYCVVVMLLRRCTRAKAHPAPFLSASKDVHLRSINEFRAG